MTLDLRVELLRKLKLLEMQEAENACYFDFGNALKQQLEEELSPEMVQLADLQAEKELADSYEE